MNKLNFKNIECLAEYMHDKSCDDKYVIAVLFYDKASKLIKSLLAYDDVELESLQIEPPEWNDYTKEYYVILSCDNNTLLLSAEPAFKYGKYLGTWADLLLIDGSANSTVLLDILDHDWFDMSLDQCVEIDFDGSCDDCDNYDYCYCNHKEDDATQLAATALFLLYDDYLHMI